MVIAVCLRLCYGKRCMLACVAAANRSLSTTRWLFDKDKEVDKDKEILGRWVHLLIVGVLF